MLKTIHIHIMIKVLFNKTSNLSLIKITNSDVYMLTKRLFSLFQIIKNILGLILDTSLL